MLYIVPRCIRNASGLRFTFALWGETYNKVFFLVCRLNSWSDSCWATCEQVPQVSVPTCTHLRLSHTNTLALSPCGNSSPRKGILPAGYATCFWGWGCFVFLVWSLDCFSQQSQGKLLALNSQPLAPDATSRLWWSLLTSSGHGALTQCQILLCTVWGCSQALHIIFK